MRYFYYKETHEYCVVVKNHRYKIKYLVVGSKCLYSSQRLSDCEEWIELNAKHEPPNEFFIKFSRRYLILRQPIVNENEPPTTTKQHG